LDSQRKLSQSSRKLELKTPYSKTHLDSSIIAEIAQKHSLEATQVQKQLTFPLDSPYQLESLEWNINDAVYIHNRDLRQLKQEIIKELNQAQHQAFSHSETLNNTHSTTFFTPLAKRMESAKKGRPRLHILIREEQQLNELAGLDIDTIYMDFEWGKEYKSAMEKIRAMGYRAGIATLRIEKPNEDHHRKVIEALKPDVVLIRNLSSLHTLSQGPWECVGDHGLNVCNSASAQWMQKKGLKRITPSYDLNQEQLDDYLQHSPLASEMSVHHYMPAFYMEHCVFAAYLSKGSGFPDCGKPCEKHRVEVRDHKGETHYLKADQECRNTLYRGSPQSAIKLWEGLFAKGVKDFRIEMLWESPAEVRTKAELYSAVFSGKKKTSDLLQQLAVEEKYGITEGQLFNTTPWQDRKKED
jgi:putative protease